MSFSEGRSFLILRQTDSGREFVPSKKSPIPFRAKVVGRALLAARTDANSFWMILSGHAEVAFPSRTATIAPAADNASTTANVAAVAASMLSDLTPTETGRLPTAAAVATAATRNPSMRSFAVASKALAQAADTRSAPFFWT
jgi:hypothetical protein